MRRIKFQGKDYIMEESEEHGAITTEEKYKNGEVSYAHLFPNGIIKRFGIQIGTKNDIIFGENVEIVPNLPEALFNLLNT